jgi:hypothetical protein
LRREVVVKRRRVRSLQRVHSHPDAVPGTARLVAKSAGHRSAYERQYSLDPKTWTAMPVTFQAKTDVSGHISDTAHAFRFRPFLKTGKATWSQVVVEPIH